MKNLVWHNNIDINEIFPQSFDLSDLASEEVKDFKQSFKFCGIISYLKQAVTNGINFIKKNRETVIICLGFCERRKYVLSGQVFNEDPATYQESFFDTISDEAFLYICKPN